MGFRQELVALWSSGQFQLNFDAGDAGAVESARAGPLELAGVWADSLATAAPVKLRRRMRGSLRAAVESVSRADFPRHSMTWTSSRQTPGD